MSQHTSLNLKPEQRAELENLIHSGNAPARAQTRARILLLTDRSLGQQRSDEEIAEVLLCSKSTLGNARGRFLTEDRQAALYTSRVREPAPKSPATFKRS